MFLKPKTQAFLNTNVQRLLGNWSQICLLSIALFALASLFGWKAYIGLKQHIRLNEMVTWYGRGNGNAMQYRLSSLIAVSLLWLTASLGLLLAGWIYNRYHASK